MSDRDNPKDRAADRRKHLLARMAGNIAAGSAGYCSLGDEDIQIARRNDVAAVAVDIAERILQRIGL